MRTRFPLSAFIFLFLASVFLVSAATAIADPAPRPRASALRSGPTKLEARLAKVGKGGYTVEELASIHEFSRRRENPNFVRTPGIMHPTELGQVEIVSAELLSHYVPGDAVDSIQKAFARAAAILEFGKFPISTRKTKYDWRLFVEDSNQDREHSGFVSSERCHTAWMGPPANVFLAVDRLINQCGGDIRRSTQEVLQALDETLVHEIGHAVEFRMMGKGFSKRQRWHSEGFATWFEALPSGQNFSAKIFNLLKEAKQSFDPNWQPSMFSGSKDDYSRSFSMIAALADKHSTLGVIECYKRMGDSQIRLEQAVEAQFGWSLPRWIEETRVFLDRSTIDPMTVAPVDIVKAKLPLNSAAEDSQRIERRWSEVSLLPDFTVDF